jgi:hypothetical protein
MATVERNLPTRFADGMACLNVLIITVRIFLRSPTPIEAGEYPKRLREGPHGCGNMICLAS